MDIPMDLHFFLQYVPHITAPTCYLHTLHKIVSQSSVKFCKTRAPQPRWTITSIIELAKQNKISQPIFSITDHLPPSSHFQGLKLES